MLTLIEINGESHGEVFRVREDQRVRIGRKAEDIRITDTRLSRQHAEVRLEGGRWVVEDLRSTNGTHLNGRRIEAPTGLRAGDHLRLGRTLLVVGQAEVVDRGISPGPGGGEGADADRTIVGETALPEVPMIAGGGDQITSRHEAASADKALNPEDRRDEDEAGHAGDGADQDQAQDEAGDEDPGKIKDETAGGVAAVKAGGGEADLVDSDSLDELDALFDESASADDPPPAQADPRSTSDQAGQAGQADLPASTSPPTRVADRGGDPSGEAWEADPQAPPPRNQREALDDPVSAEDPDPVMAQTDEHERDNTRRWAAAGGVAVVVLVGIVGGWVAFSGGSGGEAGKTGGARGAGGEVVASRSGATSDRSDSATTTTTTPSSKPGRAPDERARPTPPSLTPSTPQPIPDLPVEPEASQPSQPSKPLPPTAQESRVDDPSPAGADQPESLSNHTNAPKSTANESKPTAKAPDTATPSSPSESSSPVAMSPEPASPPRPASDEPPDPGDTASAFADGPELMGEMALKGRADVPQSASQSSPSPDASGEAGGAGGAGDARTSTGDFQDAAEPPSSPRSPSSSKSTTASNATDDGDQSASTASPGPPRINLAPDSVIPQGPESSPAPSSASSDPTHTPTGSDQPAPNPAPPQLAIASLPPIIEAPAPTPPPPSPSPPQTRQPPEPQTPPQAQAPDSRPPAGPAPSTGLVPPGAAPEPPAPSVPPAGIASTVATAGASESSLASSPATTIDPEVHAFLVDVSGSLVDSYPLLIDYLQKQIQKLPADQRFAVIFFRQGQVFEVPPAGAKEATAAAKQAAMRWIEPAAGHVTLRGRSDPTSALRRALSYGAGQITVLSDDTFAGRPDTDTHDKVLAEFGKLIGDRPVTINAAQFFYHDKGQTLQALARRYGGTYQFIGSPDDQLQNTTALVPLAQ